MAQGLAPLLPVRPTLKWPNDVLCRGRKLCGLLLEMSATPQRIDHVILGAGVNVNSQRFPDPLRERATSLRLERGGPALPRLPVLLALLEALEPWLDRLQREGPAPVIAAWLGYAPWVGQVVGVSLPPDGRELQGTALGLDPRGGLRLRLADGEERVVLAGELALA